MRDAPSGLDPLRRLFRLVERPGQQHLKRAKLRLVCASARAARLPRSGRDDTSLAERRSTTARVNSASAESGRNPHIPKASAAAERFAVCCRHRTAARIPGFARSGASRSIRATVHRRSRPKLNENSRSLRAKASEPPPIKSPCARFLTVAQLTSVLTHHPVRQNWSFAASRSRRNRSRRFASNEQQQRSTDKRLAPKVHPQRQFLNASPASLRGSE